MIDTINSHDLDGLLRNATAWRVTVERLAQELERDEATSASFPSAGGVGSISVPPAPARFSLVDDGC